MRVPQVTDFAQRAEGRALDPQHHSGPWSSVAHLSVPHSCCSFFPPSTLQQPKTPRFFLWLLVPTPSVSPSSLRPLTYTPPPHLRCLLRSSAASPTIIVTIITLSRPPQPPGKGGAGGTITSLDPLWLYFLHSRPFPKCRPPNGDPAQPPEPLRSAEPACAEAASPLLCARSFCIWWLRLRRVLFSSF